MRKLAKTENISLNPNSGCGQLTRPQQKVRNSSFFVQLLRMSPSNFYHSTMFHFSTGFQRNQLFFITEMKITYHVFENEFAVDQFSWRKLWKTIWNGILPIFFAFNQLTKPDCWNTTLEIFQTKNCTETIDSRALCTTKRKNKNTETVNSNQKEIIDVWYFPKSLP